MELQLGTFVQVGRAGQLGVGPHKSFEQRVAQSASNSPPRQVVLTDAVKEFLAKPVTGPYRPIVFDLETTGNELLSSMLSQYPAAEFSGTRWL